MKELWEMCRKLSNPERLGLLRKIYALKGEGITVTDAADGGKLGQSGTSQYLKQLMELGLLRRERGGRFVGYYADCSTASPKIREIGEMLYRRFQSSDCDMGFVQVLGAMGNAFRARVVAHIASGGDGSKLALATRHGKAVRLIARDLKPAVKAGLLTVDSDDELGCYGYLMPADPIARRIVELSA